MRPSSAPCSAIHSSNRSRPSGGSWETSSPARSDSSSSPVTTTSRRRRPAHASRCEGGPEGCAHDPSTTAHGGADQPNEFLVRPALLAGRVEHDVVVAGAGLDSDPSHVVDRHGLHLVAPAAGNEEERDVPQAPGDVVDEDVLRPEDERRPHDRVGEPGVAEPPFGLRLAAVIRKGGPHVGVGNAEVHDSAHARVGRRLEEARQVGDRTLERRSVAFVANPVRAVERVRAVEAVVERVVEAERPPLDALRQRVLGSGGRRVSVRTARPRSSRSSAMCRPVNEKAPVTTSRATDARQPGLAATQISSTGHARAHSAGTNVVVRVVLGVVGSVELDEIDHVESRPPQQPEELAVWELPLDTLVALPLETAEAALRTLQRRRRQESRPRAHRESRACCCAGTRGARRDGAGGTPRGSSGAGRHQMLAPYSDTARSNDSSGSGTPRRRPRRAESGGRALPGSGGRWRAARVSRSTPTGRAPRRASQAET